MGRDGATPVPPATRLNGGRTHDDGAERPAQDRVRLPLGEEWQQVLGLPAPAAVQPQPDYEGNICSTAEPGTRREAQRVVRDAAQPDATFLGVQTYYSFVSPDAARAGATELAQGIAQCSAPIGPRRLSASGPAAQWPRIWSYTKDGRTGWLAIAQYGTAVAWLEIAADPPQGPAADQADMTALARRAAALAAHGGAVIPNPRHHAASAGGG